MQIGLWGCGNMGKGLARALAATGEASLIAAYDVLPEAAAEVAEEHGAAVADTAESLLSRRGLDGVIIALPSYLHAPATIEAAEAGVNVFVEKPMSLDVARCREMISAAQQHGTALMVGHVLRYYEPYRTILRWKAEGRYGAPFAASIWRVVDGSRVRENRWQVSRALSGGYLFEVSIHELDMLRCLLGTPATVDANVRKQIPSAVEWADHIAVQIRFAGGTAAAYEGGVGSHTSRYGFRIYFEGATLLSDAAFDRTALRVFEPGGVEVDLAPNTFSPEPPVEAELRGWLAALRGEGPVPIPGEEGMASVAMSQSAYLSAERGAPVAYGQTLGGT